jgi:hypothetical protein
LRFDFTVNKRREFAGLGKTFKLLQGQLIANVAKRTFLCSNKLYQLATIATPQSPSLDAFVTLLRKPSVR